MKFELINYEYDKDDSKRINYTYKIVGENGLLDIQVNREDCFIIELFLKSISKLYRTDEFVVFDRNRMYKCYKGYYQDYRRY